MHKIDVNKDIVTQVNRVIAEHGIENISSIRLIIRKKVHNTSAVTATQSDLDDVDHHISPKFLSGESDLSLAI